MAALAFGRAQFGEAAGTHDDAAHAGRGAIAHRFFDGLRGNGQEGAVYPGGHLADAAPARLALNAVAGRVDGVDLPGKTAANEVAHNRMAELARLGGGADDGDAARCQQGLQAAAGGGD